jgi:hypothetical protein
MNTSEPIDLTFFIDKDNSPFILFNQAGAIRYLNNGAEILLAYANKQELYDLALTYAPRDFGSRTIPIELNYRQLSFYAITVAYENEEWIGIRLYYRPRPKAAHRIDTNRLKLTNINTILEATITLFAMQNPTPFDLLTDADLPEFKLDQNGFSKLLRKSLHLFRASAELHISLTMAIGESIILDQKRHPIVRLTIQANGRYSHDDLMIKALAEEMRIVTTFEERYLLFDIPFITN